MSLWRLLFYQPVVNLLFGLTQVFGGSLGWGIVTTSIVLRLLLTPFFLFGIRDTVKLQKLMPKLQSLREKYGSDLLKMAQAQSQLYQKAGINPALSIVSQILPIVFLIAFYSGLQAVLRAGGNPQVLTSILYPPLQKFAQKPINLKFWYLHLNQPDTIRWQGFVFPGFFVLLAVFAQWRSFARPTTPGVNIWIFIFLTLLFGLSFPSGIVLYWAVFSLLAWWQLEATYHFFTRSSKNKKGQNQNQKGKA